MGLFEVAMRLPEDAVDPDTGQVDREVSEAQELLKLFTSDLG